MGGGEEGRRTYVLVSQPMIVSSFFLFLFFSDSFLLFFSFFFSIFMIKNINILCLNYGGMVGKDKILRIKLLKVELKLDIIVLVEVCANESRITPFCSKLSKG